MSPVSPPVPPFRIASGSRGARTRTVSARHQRSREMKANVKLDIVVTDTETAKRVNTKSPLLFTSAECKIVTPL